MSYNASSTYKSFLMRSTDGVTFTKVIDIKDYPDMGEAPSTLPTTTMTDAAQTSVFGIPEGDNFQFTANYDPSQFAVVNSYAVADEAGPVWYALWFGGTDNPGADPTPTGNMGRFTWRGQMGKPYVSGAGVNAVRDMMLSISRASTIYFSYDGSVNIRLNKSAVTIEDGATASLVATVDPNTATVVWSSSDTSVATVSSGTVTAVDPGIAVITATAEKDGVIAYTSCVVTVTE